MRRALVIALLLATSSVAPAPPAGAVSSTQQADGVGDAAAPQGDIVRLVAWRPTQETVRLELHTSSVLDLETYEGDLRVAWSFDRNSDGILDYDATFGPDPRPEFAGFYSFLVIDRHNGDLICDADEALDVPDPDDPSRQMWAAELPSSCVPGFKVSASITLTPSAADDMPSSFDVVGLSGNVGWTREATQRVTFTGSGALAASANGGVFTLGESEFHGSLGGLRLNQPIVGIAMTAERTGYWLVAADGGIFSFGTARFHGSTGAIRLNQPIVGMAATPTGDGYWLVARDGGIFAFGDARFHGSMGGTRLNQPVVGMAASPSGKGYWLVAADGGIFAFGDARYHGSTGAIRLNQPIVGMAASLVTDGYWLVARDGGVFAFDVPFHGSPVNDMRGSSAVAIFPSGTSEGYHVMIADGRATNFGWAGAITSQAIATAPIVGATLTS